MHSLVIKEIPATNLEIPSTREYPPVALDQVNWEKESQYQPEVYFRIGYNASGILLQFQVQEAEFRATISEDYGKIWEDSCVEFFVSPDLSPYYYNFEFNALGSLLLAYGADREHRTEASHDVMDSIRRSTTIQCHKNPTSSPFFSWNLHANIPFSAFFKTPVTFPKNQIWKANLYKCGNKLPHPHYLSWNPIRTPRPDFHRPEFFGTLIFQ